MRKIAALFLSVLLIASLTACGAKQEYAVKYHVKINPEFEVYADENLNVLRVDAVNEDAEAVLANINVEGVPVANAFNIITEEAKNEGFMTEEKGNTVEITIDEIDEKTLAVCPVCGGGGTLTCWDCDGTAKRKCPCENGLDECGHCHGTGAIDCDCDGGFQVCTDCGGEGWKACDQCGGAGKLENTCFNCGGTGNCPDCGGRGYVIVTAGDTGNVVYNADGTTSLQILESSQINTDDERSRQMFASGTHFNPVDLVCGITDYNGQPFHLPEYVDPSTGFISHKSKGGRELLALELPGLWNGAMSNWLTLFVEVPLTTFNPVKTVNDLLRPQHQPEDKEEAK